MLQSHLLELFALLDDTLSPSENIIYKTIFHFKESFNGTELKQWVYNLTKQKSTKLLYYSTSKLLWLVDLESFIRCGLLRDTDQIDLFITTTETKCIDNTDNTAFLTCEI